MLSFAVAVCVGCDESLTEKETMEVPTVFCAGVPEMEPVEELMERPEGRPVALKTYGVVPPVAETEAAYAPPAVPLARLLVLMLSAVAGGEDGGLPEDEGGVPVMLPQPASSAVQKRRETLVFCIRAASCV